MGKRVIVRWLKLFRYKKKKEYERMTVEEKLLYKLRNLSFALLLFWSLSLELYTVIYMIEKKYIEFF